MQTMFFTIEMELTQFNRLGWQQNNEATNETF